MASTAFLEELAKASLSEEGLGFFELKDSVVFARWRREASSLTRKMA
jgi:hypothetical protein